MIPMVPVAARVTTVHENSPVIVSVHPHDAERIELRIGEPEPAGSRYAVLTRSQALTITGILDAVIRLTPGGSPESP